MTTTLYLIRHGSHDRLGKVLCGRMDGVGLSETGRAEADRTATRLAQEPIAALYSSPLQRARETAEALARRTGLELRIEEGLSEIDFGAWTGARFESLAEDSRWGAWCAQRSLNRPPPGESSGESMGEAQVRALRGVERIRQAHPDQAVALFSHADLIKALIAHWLGLALDFYNRFDIDPASVSTAVVGEWGARVLRINEGVRP